MKKFFLLAIVFCSLNLTETVSAADTVSLETTQCITGDNYVTSVEAQNQNGTETRYFRIMSRINANGTYYFYAEDNNGTYVIQYADRNNYKPFYVKIGEERWYFSCKELDRASGKTTQW